MAAILMTGIVAILGAALIYFVFAFSIPTTNQATVSITEHQNGDVLVETTSMGNSKQIQVKYTTESGQTAVKTLFAYGDHVVLENVATASSIQVFSDHGGTTQLIREYSPDPGTVSGPPNAGGGSSPRNGNGSGSGCSSSDIVFVDNPASKNIAYPGSGAGTASNPYKVTNVCELQHVAYNPYKHYRVTEDIDASNTSSWDGGAGFMPIENFEGEFDGNGKTISGLTINRPGENEVGLFGNTKVGSIHTFTLNAISVTGKRTVGGAVAKSMQGTIHTINVSGTVRGDSQVGGAAGRIENGNITRIHVDADVTGSNNRVGGLVGHGSNLFMTNSSMNGSIEGQSEVGGLAGNIVNSRLRHSISRGTVEGNSSVGGISGKQTNGEIRRTIRDGKTTGKQYTGGIVGEQANGLIVRSRVVGDVTGTNTVGGAVGLHGNGRFQYVGVRSNVAGDNTVGGLVGESTNENVTDSYFRGDVSGNNTVGGVFGQTQQAAVVNTYVHGNISGSSTIGGLIGSTTSSRIATSYIAGDIRGSTTVGAVVGSEKMATMDAVYWDTTKVSSGSLSPSGSGGWGARNAHGLTTSQMTGKNASKSMKFNWGDWTKQLNGYPVLREEPFVIL